MIQKLKLGFAALLVAITVTSVSAAPPQTGIRGQNLFQQSLAVEAAPGVWVGDTWWGGLAFSFSVVSAHSGREVTHVSTGDFGSFELSLPPGQYVIVPDALPGYVRASSFEVTVTAKHFTDVSIVYGVPATFFP